MIMDDTLINLSEKSKEILAFSIKLGIRFNFACFLQENEKSEPT